jgi:hypothetical protein
MKIIYLDLTYQNHNPHYSHINSNGKTSLGKFICETKSLNLQTIYHYPILID